MVACVGGGQGRWRPPAAGLGLVWGCWGGVAGSASTQRLSAQLAEVCRELRPFSCSQAARDCLHSTADDANTVLSSGTVPKQSLPCGRATPTQLHTPPPSPA